MAPPGEPESCALFVCASRKRYRAPAEIAWDHDLGLEKQVRTLEKWYRIAARQYVESRSLADLRLLREIAFVLGFVRRARDGDTVH